MTEIYDNGVKLLGKVSVILLYIKKNWKKLEWQEEIDDLIKELEEYSASDIVAINYDNPMGYTIESWKEESKIVNP